MLIRRARPEDVPALAALFQHSARTAGPAAYTPAQIEAWAASGEDLPKFEAFILGVHTYVAVQDGKPVGFGGLREDGYIASLYVHGDHLRQGIGSRLMEAMLAEAEEKQMPRLHSIASVFSKPVFERFGLELYATEDVFHNGVPFTRYLMQRRRSGSYTNSKKTLCKIVGP